MDAFKGVFKLQQDLCTKFNLYLKRLSSSFSQLSDMDEASSMATSTRLELDKLKKLHAAELDLVASEKLDAMNALAVAEANMNAMEDEVE